MDNVIALPFVTVTNKEDSGFVSRIVNALSGLPDTEQERMVRIFELMALSMELEMLERGNDPQTRR